MSFRLKSGEELDRGIRRIAREQLDRALKELQSGDRRLSDAVHQSRKRLKKVRGLLRLVRDELGTDTYHEENRAYRDIGRKLAPLRDAQVRLDTVRELKQHFGEVLDADAFSDLFDEFGQKARKAKKNLVEERNVIDQVCREIQAGLGRIPEWPIERSDFGVVGLGLRRVYKRGRKGYRKSTKNPTAEELHDWRKRAKYLWYHFRILRPVWPRICKSWAKSCHDLSRLLGELHDLSELKVALRGSSTPSKQECQVILGLIDRRHRELETAAVNLGGRIFAEKPSAFLRRMKTYWEHWRGEGSLGSIQ